MAKWRWDVIDGGLNGGVIVTFGTGGGTWADRLLRAWLFCPLRGVLAITYNSCMSQGGNLRSINEHMLKVFADHSRQWRDYRYVYPVISRRSRGLSIGVNLNPDKSCNFDCVYCNVDRTGELEEATVDLSQLRDELDQMLGMVEEGTLWEKEPFDQVVKEYRRLNDMALSGDGEPTQYEKFDRVVKLLVEVKAEHHLPEVKLLLITNASGLDRPEVKRALTLFDANHGQIWAKLDAGTEGYFRKVNRTRVPLKQIVRNIRDTGRDRKIIVQSMFIRLDGQMIDEAEFAAYIKQVGDLLTNGCRIESVHLYTLARPAMDDSVTPLADWQLQDLAVQLRQKLPGLKVEVFFQGG